MTHSLKEDLKNWKNIEMSFTVPPTVRLFIFDFDNTILRTHTGGAIKVWNSYEYLSRSGKLETFIESFADPYFFKKLVDVIVSKGCAVGIASFADERMITNPGEIAGAKMISTFMDYLWGSKDVPLHEKLKNIIGRMGNTKNNHIMHLARMHGITNFSQVAFFDDDIKNVNAAKYFLPGINAYHIPIGGLNRKFWVQTFVEYCQ